uniref:Craniofacial development protein 2-like n=1 Tax=Nicotiana tabacum TaxID=4097 RepID=A0A1S4D683_TOBAC|nr:PREDICTED: uncharacterized protein LOC107826423 [Nicotiana tabacum]
MTIKLVVGECTLNVVSAYAPQASLDEKIKRCFWEGLDDIVRNIPPSESLFIGGDFNGHIGSSTGGYTKVHGGFSFGERNGGGTSLLDFSKAFDLVIANSSFPKWEEHLNHLVITTMTIHNSIRRYSSTDKEFNYDANEDITAKIEEGGESFDIPLEMQGKSTANIEALCDRSRDEIVGKYYHV